MRPFVDSPEMEARIIEIARTWVRTPYVNDGAIKGAGVSCSALPYAILTEAGASIPTPPPRGTMIRREVLPTMIAWLDEHPDLFLRLAPEEPHQVGDVIVFNAGMGHMTLCVGNGNVVHCIQQFGVRFETYRSQSVCGKLVAAWRHIIP